MDDHGVEDAAILLMSLGEEEAAEVFKHLAPKEVQRLGETIAKMKAVTRERVDGVLEKFSVVAGDQSMLVADTDEYVKAVLRKALGDDKANLLIDRILQGSDISGIESLKWMDATSVAELLRNEHPQIVAAILVHLDHWVSHNASPPPSRYPHISDGTLVRSADLAVKFPVTPYEPYKLDLNTEPIGRDQSIFNRFNVAGLASNVVDPANEQSATAVLDKISGAVLIGARQRQARTQLLAGVVEQLLVDSKRARDTETASMNMQLMTWRDGQAANRAFVAGAGDALCSWRQP